VRSRGRPSLPAVARLIAVGSVTPGATRLFQPQLELFDRVTLEIFTPQPIALVIGPHVRKVHQITYSTEDGVVSSGCSLLSLDSSLLYCCESKAFPCCSDIIFLQAVNRVAETYLLAIRSDQILKAGKTRSHEIQRLDGIAED
jgi:hypothetical protein